MIGPRNLLHGLGRQIKVYGSNVHILKSPTEFQDTLLKLSSEVKNRARVSTLYIGKGDAEQRIVDNLAASARHHGSDVSVIIDRYRGTRDGGFVLRELRRMGMVHLYQAPYWRRVWYRKPGFVGELLGVHHMKYYLFDDNVIISGANMSDIYFDQRQDRYFLIKSKQLADYICYFHHLHESCTRTWDLDNFQKSIWSTEALRVAATTSSYFSCNTPIENRPELRYMGPSDGDTFIFPLFQLPHFSVHQIDDALALLLSTANSNQRFTLSSGYFNPSKRLTSALKNTKSHVDLIIPSVEANGFYKGAHLKGYVPDLYNLLAIRTAKRCPNVSIHEYSRDGWSFHGKGLWSNDCTILGSSNFNQRSTLRDTEFALGIVTENENLKDALGAERDYLMSFTKILQSRFRPISVLGFPVMRNFL